MRTFVSRITKNVLEFLRYLTKKFMFLLNNFSNGCFGIACGKKQQSLMKAVICKNDSEKP